MKNLTLYLTLIPTLAFSSQENTPVVGQVTMSAGEVEIIRSNGQRISAQRRSDIMEGDILETGPTGIIHIRFIDEALVSVSCESALKIQQYGTENNQIVELDLIKGHIRSITGTINPDKYILHTASADVRISRSPSDFIVSEELGANASFSVANGGIRVENYSGALNLGIGGDFNFAEVAKDQPPNGLAFAPAAISCD